MWESVSRILEWGEFSKRYLYLEKEVGARLTESHIGSILKVIWEPITDNNCASKKGNGINRNNKWMEGKILKEWSQLREKVSYSNKEETSLNVWMCPHLTVPIWNSISYKSEKATNVIKGIQIVLGETLFKIKNNLVTLNKRTKKPLRWLTGKIG